MREGLQAGALLGAGSLVRMGGAALRLFGDVSASAGGRGEEESLNPPMLIVIFLRGGADGLHLLAPRRDPDYRAIRGPLALESGIALPRHLLRTSGAEPGFELHPAFAPLGPLVAGGRLAAIPAIGSPDTTRSHFEAQDAMENGLAPRGIAVEGWLARGLAARDDRSATHAPNPFSLIAIGDAPPLSIRGSDSFAIRDAERLGLLGAGPAARAILREAYDTPSAADPVRAVGHRALAALAEYEGKQGRPGAGRRGRHRRAGPNLLADAKELTGLCDTGLAVRAACLEGDGWDSHQGQGADEGPVAARIRDLAEAIAHLDAEAPGSLVVVMSEFGRTVHPNGSRGTDHGHAGTMLVGGSGVAGGVHGTWTGLARDRLHEGRDVPVLTDYRSVLFETLQQHLGEPPPAGTFPGFAPAPLGLFA